MKNKKQVKEVLRVAVEDLIKKNNVAFVMNVKRAIAISGDVEMVISCFIDTRSEFYDVLCTEFFVADKEHYEENMDKATLVWKKYKEAQLEAYRIVKDGD